MSIRNFTLKQLNYLVQVSKAGSITDAGRMLNVSQPSISTAISHLEAVFGFSLFVRQHAKGLTLTPEGRNVVAAAQRVLDEAELLGQFADEMRGEVSGVVEIGCVITLAPILMPSIIAEAGKRYPKAQIKAHAMSHGEMIGALNSGAMAMALTYDLPTGPEFDFMPLQTLESYALLPKGHPLANRGRASLHELAQDPLILLDLPMTADFFESMFRLYDVPYRIAHRSSSPQMVRAMVANGLGFALFNAPLLDDTAIDGRPIRRVEVEEKLPNVTCGILTQRGRVLSHAAGELKKLMKNTIRL